MATVTVADACPACSARARRVSPLTVRSLVKPELAARVRDEGYRFCESSTCDVVYFGVGDAAHRFLRSDLRLRVGQKETALPIPVCYCFDWTTEDIEREIRLTGDTTIPDRIRQKVRQGFCHCETMNPQGTCCLGNVHRAVQDVRAGLAMPPDGRRKGAGLATLGAVCTAVVGSACCWLPLLLIAFGFSAAGVGSFFEQYRALFLIATFALLGVAWVLTYRAALGTAWARLVGKPAATHSCCAARPEPADCCATQPDRKAFTVRHFNQIMLGMATVLIVLFALFPQWIGLVLGGSRSATAVGAGGQEVVLEVRGMTCAGCAATARQALSKVPGVANVEVSYDRAEAVVTFERGVTVQPEALVQAAREAGYDANLKE